MIPTRRSRKAAAGPTRAKQRGAVNVPETVEEEGTSGITVHSVFSSRIGQTEFRRHDYKGKSAASIDRVRDYSKLHPALATSAQHQKILIEAEIRARELENGVRLKQLENDRFSMRVEFIKGLVDKGIKKKEEVSELLSLLN
jgi:hypothetical protein